MSVKNRVASSSLNCANGRNKHSGTILTFDLIHQLQKFIAQFLDPFPCVPSRTQESFGKDFYLVISCLIRRHVISFQPISNIITPKAIHNFKVWIKGYKIPK